MFKEWRDKLDNALKGSSSSSSSGISSSLIEKWSIFRKMSEEHTDMSKMGMEMFEQDKDDKEASPPILLLKKVLR